MIKKNLFLFFLISINIFILKNNNTLMQNNQLEENNDERYGAKIKIEKSKICKNTNIYLDKYILNKDYSTDIKCNEKNCNIYIIFNPEAFFISAPPKTISYYEKENGICLKKKEKFEDFFIKYKISPKEK